jgi:hypothetical protein
MLRWTLSGCIGVVLGGLCSFAEPLFYEADVLSGRSSSIAVWVVEPNCSSDIEAALEDALEECEGVRLAWDAVGPGRDVAFLDGYGPNDVAAALASSIRSCPEATGMAWSLDCSEAPCLVVMNIDPLVFRTCGVSFGVGWYSVLPEQDGIWVAAILPPERVSLTQHRRLRERVRTLSRR